MQQTATLQPPKFVDLNVLPEELRPRRHPAWYIAGVGCALALSVLLIPLCRAEQAGGAETARLRAEVEMMKGELAQAQIDFGRLRELRGQLETTEAAIVELNEERQAVLGDAPELSTALPAMRLALPPGADLGSVTGSEGLMGLTGHARSAADAIEYARALVRGRRFSDAQVTSLAAAGGPEQGGGVTFTIEVTP